MMTETPPLSPQAIRQRITDCRTELIALKKMLKFAEAAAVAEEARRRRSQSAPISGQEVVRAS
jgi:hypothetical protein